MTNHRKLVLKLLAALIVLAGAMDASGVRLARPEYQGSEEDIWIGYFLAWERLPGEGEVIPRNGEGWVEYGSQTMEVSGLGSASIPREILIGQYSEEKGFTFPGMEGYSAVLALVRGEYGNTLLAGNQLMDGKTHVSETSSSLSGAVCYGSCRLLRPMCNKTCYCSGYYGKAPYKIKHIITTKLLLYK